MGLTATARRYLRKLGRPLPAIVQVGKSGMTESLQRQVSRMLGHRELIKIKTLDTCPAPIDEVASQLAEITESALVAVVGKTALLFRPNPDLPVDKRITLPS